MTTPNGQENGQVEQKSKEENLALIRQHYERKLAQEVSEREKLQMELQESKNQRVQHDDDDDDDDEPYVVKKKLDKKLAKFGEQAQKQTQSDIQRAVQMALQEERKQNWIKQNPDFYDTLQHAEKLAMKDPELAETILSMPDGFERQKLVHKTIKALGLHEAPKKEPSIQEKIDANKKGYYYQPSSVGTAPYSNASDFTPTGQKQAYDIMQGLKARLRLG